MREKKSQDSSEYKYAVEKINQWYKKGAKVLTIASLPYNSITIFKPIINDILKKNGKILYVWGEKREIKDLINDTLITTLKLKYSTIENEDSRIVFLNFEDAMYVKNTYDLIIIDDLGYLGVNNKFHIKFVVDNLYNHSKKIINYDIDKCINYGDYIEICDINNYSPVLEPRIITTKINILEDIPYVLYEYLKWFKERNRRVLIIVPDSLSYEKIIEKYIKVFKLKGIELITISENNKSITKISLSKEKAFFIITSDISNYIKDIKNLDVVMLGADDNKYSYKAMVYLSSIVSRNSNGGGEMLLVANSISYSMETSKNILRDYNKMLWEKGLLKV